ERSLGRSAVPVSPAGGYGSPGRRALPGRPPPQASRATISRGCSPPVPTAGTGPCAVDPPPPQQPPRKEQRRSTHRADWLDSVRCRLSYCRFRAAIKYVAFSVECLLWVTTPSRTSISARTILTSALRAADGCNKDNS